MSVYFLWGQFLPLPDLRIEIQDKTQIYIYCFIRRNHYFTPYIQNSYDKSNNLGNVETILHQIDLGMKKMRKKRIINSKPLCFDGWNTMLVFTILSYNFHLFRWKMGYEVAWYLLCPASAFSYLFTEQNLILVIYDVCQICGTWIVIEDGMFRPTSVTNTNPCASWPD